MIGLYLPHERLADAIRARIAECLREGRSHEDATSDTVLEIAEALGHLIGMHVAGERQLQSLLLRCGTTTEDAARLILEVRRGRDGGLHAS